MVGVGPMGEESTLARVSVVNYFGAVLLDEFVRQKERVTDWRTQWSGIRAKDMTNGDFCNPYFRFSCTYNLLVALSKVIRGGSGRSG